MAGERTIVAARQNDATGLAWSASGTELVFTVVRNGSTTLHAVASRRNDGKSYIGVVNGRRHIVNVDGGEPRPVPGAVESDLPLQVSADGQWLFVFDRRLLFIPQPDGVRLHVDRLDLATGERQPWLSIAVRDSSGVMHPGPEFQPLLITPDGRSYVYNYLRVLSDLFVVEGLR